MSKLNVPPSWGKMAFNQKQYYLVDTHQAKNLSDAAKIITKETNDQLRAAVRATLQGKVATDGGRKWYVED